MVEILLSIGPGSRKMVKFGQFQIHITSHPEMIFQFCKKGFVVHKKYIYSLFEWATHCHFALLIQFYLKKRSFLEILPQIWVIEAKMTIFVSNTVSLSWFEKFFWNMFAPKTLANCNCYILIYDMIFTLHACFRIFVVYSIYSINN